MEICTEDEEKIENNFFPVLVFKSSLKLVYFFLPFFKEKLIEI